MRHIKKRVSNFYKPFGPYNTTFLKLSLQNMYMISYLDLAGDGLKTAVKKAGKTILNLSLLTIFFLTAGTITLWALNQLIQHTTGTTIPYQITTIVAAAILTSLLIGKDKVTE